MLFPYQYVPHSMEKMQTFVDYIFYEVWCKALGRQSFNLDLFNGNTELKEVMLAFYYSDANGADFFYGHVENIYGQFATLTIQQIEQLRLWYQGNNDIEKACANDPDLQIAKYADIESIDKKLGEQLASFFKGLYSQKLLDLVALRTKIGVIDDHYQTFIRKNSVGKCPFCGIGDIKGVHHSKREAYDHYLPKGLYPFNAINFRNLAPACHECNSTYKLAKDPVYSASGRRKAFYPYTNQCYKIDIRIELKHRCWENIAPDDITFEFGPIEINEEIATWKEIYGIDERYKAKCCSESDGKEWIVLIFDEWRGDGRTPDEYLKTLTRSTERSPFADSNFLKKAFLEGCERAGLFATVANEA
jgi:hypothetical protein